MSKSKVFSAIAGAMLFAAAASAEVKEVMRRENPTAVPPREVVAQVGVYLWGYLPPADPADNGWKLITAAKRAKSLGARIIRTYIGSYWDPQGISSGLPLDQLVQRQDYDTVLDMFDTVIFTAYDLASCDMATHTPIYRERPLTADELAAERAERMKFVGVMAVRHPNTKIVIGDWESEHDVVTDDQAPAFVTSTVTWLTATRDAVTILRQSGYAANISTMFEMVFPVPVAGQKFNGLATAVSDLAPNGKPLWDFISYSSWDSMMYGVDPKVNAASYSSAFDTIRSACSAAGFSCDDKIVVGEVGTLRNLDPQSELLDSAVWESLKQDAQCVINWVLADQPGEGVTVDGVFYDQSQWGKYDAMGAITSQGLDVAGWYAWGILAPDMNPERSVQGVGKGLAAQIIRGFRPRHPMDAPK